MAHHIYRYAAVTFFGAMSVVLLFPTQPVEAKGDRVTEAFGANIHLRQRIVPESWNAVMGEAHEAGVQWGREEFNWDVIEPTNDNFSWAAYDSVVDTYEAKDMKMLGLLTYSSTWASSNSASSDYEFYPPDMNAWEDYVQEVAERYSGRVDYWEIWNEPNHGGFWKGTQAQYVDLVQRAANAIKNANPEAKIVLGGVSGSDYEFIDEVLTAMEDPSIIDVIAIHPYRQTNGNFNYKPEVTVAGLNTLVNDIYNVKAVANRHGLDRAPIWFTEVGWTTYSAGVTEEDQAKYLMRLYTIALSVPNVEKIFWYTLTDTSSNESFFESQFGLLDHNFDPKLSASAMLYVKNNLYQKRFMDQRLQGEKVLDNFSVSRKWHFKETVCTNATLNDTAEGRLRVSYNFTGNGNCYAPVALEKELGIDAKTIQFRAKGENDNTQLRVRLTDKTGEVFQYNLGLMPNQWLYYTVQVTKPSGHWGGDNDNKLDYPLKFDSFVLDDADGQKQVGTAYFDDLVVSRHGLIFQMRYKQNNFDTYALWSVKKPHRLNVNLPGVGRIKVKVWREPNVTVNANQYFPVTAAPLLKYLQTF